jgi:hypothetical protein
MSMFHAAWEDQFKNEHVKCFGADTDWYFKTFGNMDFNSNRMSSYKQVFFEKDVTCKCTRFCISH